MKYTAPSEIYTYCHTLSLHDALPVDDARAVVGPVRAATDAQPYGYALPPFARALAANADVSLVFIANPNKPTGTVLQPREIEAFLTTTPSSVIVALEDRKSTRLNSSH